MRVEKGNEDLFIYLFLSFSIFYFLFFGRGGGEGGSPHNYFLMATNVSFNFSSSTRGFYVWRVDSVYLLETLLHACVYVCSISAACCATVWLYLGARHPRGCCCRRGRDPCQSHDQPGWLPGAGAAGGTARHAHCPPRCRSRDTETPPLADAGPG